MDFGLVFNIVIGAVALFRIVLFAVFHHTFSEAEDVHPIYRQPSPRAAAEPASLQVEEPVVRAA